MQIGSLRIWIALMLVQAMLASVTLASDEVPGSPQTQPIALVGGTIHPVSHPPIPNGTLLFDKGKIVAVGVDVEIPKNVRLVSVKGKHIYPGLFEAHSQIGLTEIASVRATRDQRESGSINPNAKAQVAVNPDTEVIPVTRSNGVLLALTAPSGGLVSGKSAVLQLDGWTYEDLTLEPNVAMHINWPRMSPVLREPDDETEAQPRDTERNEALKQLRDLFAESRAYQSARSTRESEQRFDIRLEAMVPVIQGKMPIMVQADAADQIQAAVAFATEQSVRLILLGGFDAPLCADLLKKYQVPVIVSAVYRLPRVRSDNYDSAYTLPERLRAAGLQFCISSTADSSVWNTRNLAYHAATAAAYGLPRDEALKAVTLYPAQILGVEDRVGSLEPGKDATLIISNGDPLETTTRIQSAYIQGRKVDLSDRHKRLYRKYRQKYRNGD